jgi:hypothetical protein
MAQIYRGDSTNVFHANRRNDVSVVEHLHAYHDFSESTKQESLLKQYKEDQ